MRITWIGPAAMALCALAPEAARAESSGEVRIYIENDWLNWFTERTDRFYTQGMRGEWLRPSDRSDGEFLPGIDHDDWCSIVCGKGAKDIIAAGVVNTGYGLGQNMYTPQDITIAAPQPNDRPWAGLLYVSRMARVRYDEPSLEAQREDRIEASLGIVGPPSLAGPTQIFWHDLWGFDPPEGWDNQLRTEPVVQVRYDTALRWPREEGGHWDVIPRVRANLGNAVTSAEAEVTGRLGWNLSGFGPQSIPMTADELAGGWRPTFNVFGRAGIKAVAHNIFLDGNTFARNHIRIERRPLVTEWALGAEAKVAANLWLSFQFVRRGSEFETRSGRKAPAQDFGALTVAFRRGG